MSKLYVAYGSNLNIKQMGWRCPTAKVIGIGKILDYKLTFRHVATIEPSEKSEVPVAVWVPLFLSLPPKLHPLGR